MNRTPYRIAFAAMVIGLAVACSPAANLTVTPAANDQASADETLKSAMAVDQAFSDDAQTIGMAEAFAKYMDAVGGKVIGPGEVTRGEAAIRASFKDWPADLKMSWAPDMGHGSKSGDLAVTSGRWKQTRADKVLAEGRYVTVWRKNDKGAWKGVIDIGANDPAPAKSPGKTPENTPDLQGRPG
ncbi:MAG: nuclear transport factor 2 family protein [Alphaproteobacteria bacterium]